MTHQRAFENLSDTPCPVCSELAAKGGIQSLAVMPLATFPELLRLDGRKCCRDCQATETTMCVEIGQHPDFAPARLTVANERCEGLVMPLGMMESFGLCSEGWIDPCSSDDLKSHLAWLGKHKIQDSLDAN